MHAHLPEGHEQPAYSKSNPVDSNQHPVNPQGKFVKATVAVSQPLPTMSRVHDVILTRSNGATLHIQQLQRDDMLKLVDQFVGDVA
ncbi:hypothetical protein MNBD_GAMMA12-259 [hydrothermal vent metagenome]|uniref:Uncharacterized protein n=1 Tax=hydrothermal vent metagenome TaxID=652676 RepID=A0A3B0Z1K6_9ZZZZ